MSDRPRLWSWLTVATACLLAPACGGGEEGGAADASAVIDAAFGCESSAEPGGEPFELTMGLETDGTFQELSDGDAAPLILGGQGLYMLLPELRAGLSVDADSVCFRCVMEVGPSGEFEGLRQAGVVEFRTLEASLFSASPVIILGGPDKGEMLDGATVQVSLTCDGHGLSGAVTRELALYLP